MRLSELVSNLTPATFTIVGLVLFFTVFVGIVLRTFWPGTAAAQRRANRLPLEDDTRELDDE
jgi:cbb3-type cytochrome oxidase subunit 3